MILKHGLIGVQPNDLANHNPVAVINKGSEKKIHFISAKPNQKLEINASASYDPDKNQKTSFSWWIYPEAGTYRGICKLKIVNQPIVKLTIPKDAYGKQIHLVLDVFDNRSIVVMHDYRRVINNVSKYRLQLFNEFCAL